jgi:hypothetical protein
MSTRMGRVRATQTMLRRFQVMDKAKAHAVLPQSDSPFLWPELVHRGYVISLKSRIKFQFQCQTHDYSQVMHVLVPAFSVRGCTKHSR